MGRRGGVGGLSGGGGLVAVWGCWGCWRGCVALGPVGVGSGGTPRPAGGVGLLVCRVAVLGVVLCVVASGGRGRKVSRERNLII